MTDTIFRTESPLDLKPLVVYYTNIWNKGHRPALQICPLVSTGATNQELTYITCEVVLWSCSWYRGLALGTCYKIHEYVSDTWRCDAGVMTPRTSHITLLLAPKRIRFNSGPLSCCRRHTTAITTKKWHAVGTVLGRRKPSIISYLHATPCRDGALLFPLLAFVQWNWHLQLFV